MNCISRKLQRFLVVFLLVTPLPLFAAAGKVVIAAGEVFAINAQQEQRPLQRRSDIFEGDTLVTGPDGRLQLRFEDNAILALRADSQLRISEYHGASDSQPERVLMDLLGGGFRTISGSFGKSERDAYQVRTPNASIGIRGTHYEAVFQSATLTVGVYEGGIVLTNERGSLNLGLDSEFVFAQVQAGNLPQGLLNPPANLNVPNTPQGESSGEEEEGGEEEGGEEEGDGGDENNDASLNNDDTNNPSANDSSPGTAQSTETPTLSVDDFNFSALEDALNTLRKNTVGTVELTAAESDALQNPQTTTTGILVFAPSDTGNNGQPISQVGPILVTTGTYIDQQQNEHSFYVAFESQDLTNDLDEPANFILRPDEDNILDVQGNGLFYWEYWASEENVTGVVDAGDNSSFNSGNVDQPFFYVEAHPINAELVAGGTFSLCGANCIAASGMTISPDIQGELFVSLDSLSAHGSITNTYSEQAIIEDWTINFEGQITGSTLDANVFDSTYIDSSGNINNLTGSVNGIFSAGLYAPEFVGGFAVESTDTEDEAYGVFLMEQLQVQEQDQLQQ